MAFNYESQSDDGTDAVDAATLNLQQQRLMADGHKRMEDDSCTICFLPMSST